MGLPKTIRLSRMIWAFRNSSSRTKTWEMSPLIYNKYLVCGKCLRSFLAKVEEDNELLFLSRLEEPRVSIPRERMK